MPRENIEQDLKVRRKVETRQRSQRSADVSAPEAFRPQAAPVNMNLGFQRQTDTMHTLKGINDALRSGASIVQQASPLIQAEQKEAEALGRMEEELGEIGEATTMGEKFMRTFYSPSIQRGRLEQRADAKGAQLKSALPEHIQSWKASYVEENGTHPSIGEVEAEARRYSGEIAGDDFGNITFQRQYVGHVSKNVNTVLQTSLSADIAREKEQDDDNYKSAQSARFNDFMSGNTNDLFPDEVETTAHALSQSRTVEDQKEFDIQGVWTSAQAMWLEGDVTHLELHDLYLKTLEHAGADIDLRQKAQTAYTTALGQFETFNNRKVRQETLDEKDAMLESSQDYYNALVSGDVEAQNAAMSRGMAIDPVKFARDMSTLNKQAETGNLGDIDQTLVMKAYDMVDANRFTDRLSAHEGFEAMGLSPRQVAVAMDYWENQDSRREVSKMPAVRVAVDGFNNVNRAELARAHAALADRKGKIRSKSKQNVYLGIKREIENSKRTFLMKINEVIIPTDDDTPEQLEFKATLREALQTEGDPRAKAFIDGVMREVSAPIQKVLDEATAEKKQPAPPVETSSLETIRADAIDEQYADIDPITSDENILLNPTSIAGVWGIGAFA
jgi:hypothetical protein